MLFVLPTFFFYQGFLHIHWLFTGQQGNEGDHLLFHSTTSTRSRTLRNLFATLHVRWLSRIFSRNACVCQTATGWDLPLNILGSCLSDLTLETGRFELASTITLVLQANRSIKSASHFHQGIKFWLICLCFKDVWIHIYLQDVPILIP